MPPALFAADGGRLLIIGTGDRSAIRPWTKKPVTAIRVEWVPQRYMPIGNGSATDAPSRSTSSETHCVDVLEDVPPNDIAIWRDDLVSKARGSTAERLKSILDAMYARQLADRVRAAIDNCVAGSIIHRPACRDGGH